MVKYGNVTVKLIGEDGNAFNIIGRTAYALRRDVGPDAERVFVTEAFEQESYEALLAFVQATVHVV